jgi:hypothetical protein
MYNENYYGERMKELQSDAVTIKLRLADKVFNLTQEAALDIQGINAKIQQLESKEKESKKVVDIKKPVAIPVNDKSKPIKDVQPIKKSTKKGLPIAEDKSKKVVPTGKKS